MSNNDVADDDDDDDDDGSEDQLGMVTTRFQASSSYPNTSRVEFKTIAKNAGSSGGSGDNRYFYYLKENLFYNLNGGEPMRCYLTMFGAVGITHMHPSDVLNLNQLSNELFLKSSLCNSSLDIKNFCSIRETRYLKFDSKTRYCNIKREPMASPPTALTEARIVVKVMGLYKNQAEEVKMMAHVHHLQFISNIGDEPCMC